jgi:hypothetical protein
VKKTPARKSVKQTTNKGKRKAPRSAFKPGHSGNPNGRPRKGETLSDYLTSRLPRDEWARLVAAQCRKGSLRALALYASRVEGQPLSATEIMDIDEIIELRIRIRAAAAEREKNREETSQAS